MMPQAFKQQLIAQLQESYLSRYAIGARYLTFDQKRSYHFRMNLSYFYGNITPENLAKTAGTVRELINRIFSEEQTVTIAQYIYWKKQLKHLLQPAQICSDSFWPLLDEQGTLRVLDYSIRSLTRVQKIGTSLVYQDFGRLNPGYPHIKNPTILVNLTKGIVLHIYDDRGCDVFCREEQDYLSLTKQFQPYIESYSTSMKELGYTLLTSSYGVRFTK